MVLRNDVSMNAEGPEQESSDLLGFFPHPLPHQKHHLHQQHHLHLQQQQQQQQQQQPADTSSSNACLLTSAVQLMDGVHSNGAPPHLRSKWNRIRERLGRIQTAGAENKQRRASQVLGAPSLALGSRSNSTTPTASTTPSHGQLSVPLPQPSESKAPSKPSLSCIGSLRQQPCDPSVVCQLSRRSSSRPATIDAPLPFLPHSRSNSNSSSTVTAAPQCEPVLELEDWPGAAQLPASAFFDTSLGQEQGLPAETCVEQRPFSALPAQAQASTLRRPSKHSTHPVVPRALDAARSCPLPVAAPPAPATPPTAALSSAAATPSAALSITAPAAAVPSAAGTAAGAAAGAAAAAEPPTAPAACMGGLGGGGGVLMAHLPLHSGSWGAGQHRLTTEPRLSRLARSHTFTDMSPLDKSAGSNDGDDDDGDEVYSAPVFDATAASPAATPPTLRKLSKPEQQVPLPLQPHPPCMHPKQALQMPPNALQQTPRAPLPLPPCSPPPEDHLYHRVRHRSRSHTQISPSKLQQHALASAVPAVVPGRHTTDATTCIQPPPSSTASAPLAPTSRATSHHPSIVRTASACNSDMQDAIVSPPQFRHQNAAASPHTPVHMACGSLDHAHPRPPLSPRSPPTPQPATATQAQLLAHLHQSAPNLLQQQTHAAVRVGAPPGGDNGERGGAARNHRCSLSLLLRGSSRMEQELKWGAESQKPARGKAGLSRPPATHPSDAPAAAAAVAAAAASGPLSTMPAMKGAKTDKQPMRTVASACQLSNPAFAGGTPPASHRWGAGAASNSTTEQVPVRAASSSGAIITTPSSLSCALSGSSIPLHLSRNSSNTSSSSSSSSRSPFQLHSGARSSSRKVAAPVCDSCCEISSFSSNSSGSSGSKCGADMSAAKARLLSSIPLHLSRCSSNATSSSSAGTTTPSTLSCALSSSVPSHLSRCSSNATNTSSASNSVKEPPAVAAAAAALEHAGPLHSLPLADAAEGTRTTVMEPSHSVLASVPEAELEVAEENGVAGLEGAAAAAPAAAGGPDGALQHLEQQQQQQSSNETAGGRFRAKLLASLRAVGSMGKNAY